MNNDCYQCGVCCLNRGRPPFWFSKGLDKQADVPAHLLAEIEQYVTSQRYDASHPCLWLDLPTGKCKHHEHRPYACRTYQVGGSYCNAERKKHGMIQVTINETHAAGFADEAEAEAAVRAARRGGCCGVPTE